MVTNYHRKGRFDSIRKRLARLQPPKPPGSVEYIAVWGDLEQDQEYREAMGLPPVSYSGPYVAEWGKEKDQ